jgi:hypothetical protein
MKKLIPILFLFVYSIASAQKQDLSGKWEFAIDRYDVGVAEHWYLKHFTDSINLPGSMTTNGKGEDVNIHTDWTGGINDKSFFQKEEYAAYRTAENFKVPFWLQPVKYYKGVAWYQREIEISSEWKNKTIRLFMERCHWESTLWIDGRKIGMRNALGTPQVYDFTGLLQPGKHTISIRIDNRIKEIDPGENSHSISDHTQGNWNGIAGAFYLEAKSLLSISHVDVFPMLAARKLVIKSLITNNSPNGKKISLSYHTGQVATVRRQYVTKGDNLFTDTISLPENIQYWDEFHPNLNKLTVQLNNEQSEEQSVIYGCRQWSVERGILKLNDHPVFLRGTLHCAAFPLTGYPATDKKEWIRELTIIKNHGMNHVRFHSWCPPEAAFEAGDELGMYFEIECSSWANQSSKIGDGKPIDSFIEEESQRIVNAFGNHPSFCMMSYGNEPAGDSSSVYLTKFVSYWKAKDHRRLYTSASGWPNLPVNDYLSDSAPRIQQWGQELKSILNSNNPGTDYDWSGYTSKFHQPMVTHEMGQWCAYPNFREMNKYKGIYKPKNFEIFQETLAAHGLKELADSFLLASGKLQTLCYKADIEAVLRTKNMGGFQLLGLNDFPGQGTALVGTLDVFWDEKGYVTPEQYRHFCSDIVPLARMSKLIFTNDEKLKAFVEVANYGEACFNRPSVNWKISDKENKTLFSGNLQVDSIPVGNGFSLGEIDQSLSSIIEPQQLKLEVKINDRLNDWNLWVYPKHSNTLYGKSVLLTDTLDNKALSLLEKGGKVLLSIRKGHLSNKFGGDIKIGFSSIFWNTSWTEGQAPQTLGILCNPNHPALSEFPTDYYSNYQWWDAMSHSGAIEIGKISNKIHPIVRVIDDWFTNRSLGLVFEVKVGAGKLMVSGIDFFQDRNKRAEACQLLYSITKYMESDKFQPSVELNVKDINLLLK